VLFALQTYQERQKQNQNDLQNVGRQPLVEFHESSTS
jgi:hypothetical protein